MLTANIMQCTAYINNIKPRSLSWKIKSNYIFNLFRNGRIWLANNEKCIVFFIVDPSPYYYLFLHSHVFTFIKRVRARLTVFNTTFNNISAISWWSALLVEETGIPKKTTASHWQILSHNVASSAPRHEQDSNSQLSGDKYWLD
jgi:hypothetical protein